MKRRKLIVLVVVALLLSGIACACPLSVPGLTPVRGSGDLEEETFEVSGFTGVTLACVANLYIERGDEETLRVEAEENLIPYFVVEVDGGMLDIGTKSGVELNPTEPINFYLTVEDLDTIVLAGSGEIEAPDMVANYLTVTLSGSGDVELPDLRVGKLKIDLSGSGDLNASGQADDQEIIMGGSGVYEARNLRSTEAEVDISGSGSVTIQVSDKLDVTIGGSGSVRYIGSPAVETSVSGSGTIEQIGD